MSPEKGSALDRAEEACAQRKFGLAVRELQNALPVETNSPELARQIERVLELSEWVAASADQVTASAATALTAQAQSKFEEAALHNEEAAAALAERASARAKGRLEAISATRTRRDDAYMRSFEYSILDLEVDAVPRRLTEAGSLGWELVSAVSLEDGKHRLYLRREVWVTRDPQGTAGALAPQFALGGRGAAAAAGGAGGFMFGYYESGYDMDADGDVDGGLEDSLGDLFG